MITVRVTRDGRGRIAAFRLRGHAGYADAGEADILCAAASAIAQTAIGSLQDVAGIEPRYRLDEGDLAFEVTYPDDEEAALKAETLMESCRVGLTQLEQTYGDRYIRLDEQTAR